MNFFEHQDIARRKTGFLVISFILVIILILAIIDACVYFYAKDRVDLTTLIIGTNIFVVFIILTGTIVKYLQLRTGGKGIAKMVQAIPILRDSKNPKHKQLINIVDEISIASGIVAPSLFVMDKEDGINAFVAGFDTNDTVLVVTQGTLEHLNRAELQGVIAHEFSHIFNADTKINLRLAAVLAGLLVMSQVGYVLLRSTTRSRYGYRTSSSSGKGTLGVLAGGAVLFLLGYIGLFFGNIIKSAISRQREYLSDASAVQFTRNPDGLGRALLKIKEQGNTAFMQSKNSEDLSHMCFAETIEAGFMNPFSTHPKIDDRINAIDPKGVITADFYQPKPQKPKAETSHNGTTNNINSVLDEPHKLHVLAGILMGTIGKPTATSFENAQKVINNIPAHLKEMTYSLRGAKELIILLIKELPPHAYALLEMSLPTLKEMNKVEREEFIQQIFAIAKENNTIALHEAIILTILHERLSSEAGKAIHIKYRARIKVARSFDCIQAFLIDPDNTKYSVLEFTQALKKLKYLAPSLKEEFLQECIKIVQKDKKISQYEVGLLRAICSCMDCPIPL